MTLCRRICTPNINLATQTLQPFTIILQRFTSLSPFSPQKHEQRFLDNVQSALQDEIKTIFTTVAGDRTGTLFNQKHAVRFKISTSLQCPLCHHSVSALHILSGCQHQIISGMITERHNIACRLIMKAIEAGSLQGPPIGGVFCSSGYWQQRPLTLTKPTNPRRIYEQNRPSLGMALPSPVSF